MAVARAYNCPVCGANKTLLVELPDKLNDPWVISKVEGGKYGPAAQHVHEEHPEACVLGSQEAFDCRCGHAETFYVVTILGMGGVIFRSECFCPKCGSHMRNLREFPAALPCRTCGNIMMGSGDITLG
jgi:hypothetical protein